MNLKFATHPQHLACLALLSLLTGCWVGLPHEVDRPPIALQVVAPDSRRPLPGIRVGYLLETEVLRGRFLGMIPPPEPTLTYRIANSMEAVTDAEGRATFASTGFRLPGNEQVVRETVFVNLGLDREHETVRIAAATRRSMCSEAPTRCAAGLDDLALMDRMLLEDVPTRVAIFRNANPSYGGAVLVDDGALQNWGDPDDAFRIVRDIGIRVGRGETVVVELPPAHDAAQVLDRISSLERNLAADRGDRARTFAEIAAALRTLRLHGAADEARVARWLSRERAVYSALILLDATNPEWTWKLVETWDRPDGGADPATIPPLRDAVARFPRDHALRFELGVRLCDTGSRAEGLEQLVDAARLIPANEQGKRGKYNLNIDAQQYCGDCSGGTCRVQAVFEERKLTGYR